jgi:hypothetical protein
LASQRLDADPDGRLQLAVAFGVVVQELAAHKALEWWQGGDDVTHSAFPFSVAHATWAHRAHR